MTLPDGIRVSANQSLQKTWKVRNTGTTGWNSSYRLAYVSGDRMNGADISLPTVNPNGETNLTINITTPSQPGTYTGYWQLRNAQGTLFGPKLSVKIEVQGNAPAPSPVQDITAFDISPASPSAATSVHLVGRVKQFPEFRAMRFVAGNDRFEMTNIKSVGDQYEISADWNTSSLQRGDVSIMLEVARIGDNDWSQPIRQVKTYTLIGTPAPANRPPDRPVLQRPYDWFLRDASGASASVELCANAVSDPDGNPVQYYFEVTGATNYNSGWVSSPCWTNTFSPNTYAWHVKARDSADATTDWSVETWHFSVANGGVSIGSPYERVLDPGQTQLCVEVTYGGVQAPDVKGFINTATDGSESGEWRQLDHFGPNAEQCNVANVHGFRLYPVNYATGVHAIKITAVKMDSGASAQRMTSFSVPFMRPPAPQPVSPSTPDNNNTQWNTRSIVFDWEPAMRADGYTLRVSTNPNPFGDPSPVLNVPLGANTTIFSYAFAQDYPTLYWSVRASNSAGNGDSNIASFGIDLVKPACTVSTLSAVNFDTVFTVNWGGSDNASGVRSYDVQVRDTSRGDWLDWLVDNPATLGQFIGQPGHAYDFRCRSRDKAGNVGDHPAGANTSTRIDPTARPPEPWWDNGYSSKRNISILNNMLNMDLPAGYPVAYRASGATAAEIYNASQSSPKCNDLRVVYNNTTQLDRLVTKCSSSDIEIWFRNQAAIPAGGTSNAHQLYFGNASAGAPPSAPGAVWQPSPDGSTVALYYFQEGSGSQAYDASGYNRTCNIDSTVQWSTSKFAQGLRFNRANAGDSQSLNCASTPVLSSFSTDFWYKSDAEGDGRIAGGGLNWQLSNFEGRMRLDVWPCGSCGSSEVRSNFSLRDTPYINKWHHIAITFNGVNEVRFYLDGALDSVKYLSQSGITPLSPPLQIGSVGGLGQLLGNLGAFRLSSGVRSDFGYGAMANVTTEPGLALGNVVNPSVAGSADLAILGVNAYPYLNGAMLVEAIVKNQGTLPTRNNFFTDLYLNHVPAGKGDLAGSARFWVNDSINPGDVVTLTTVIDSLPAATALNAQSIGEVDAIAAAQETNATLYAQADSSGFVSEPNVNDNIYAEGLDVCVTSNDTFEDDNGLAQAKDLALGQTQRRNFGSPSDEDWVRVALAGGQNYAISTSNLDYGADTMLELYDTNGALLGANDDTNQGLESSILYAPAASGSYLVRVRHWNSNAGGCGTSYSIGVSSVAAPDTTPPAAAWEVPVADGQTFTVTAGVIQLRAGASDNIGVTSVIFSRVDSGNGQTIPISTDSDAPYEASLDVQVLSMGNNQISVTAFDAAGNSTTKTIWINRTEGTTPTGDKKVFLPVTIRQ